MKKLLGDRQARGSVSLVFFSHQSWLIANQSYREQEICYTYVHVKYLMCSA